MEQENQAFSKAEIKEFAKFFESDTGKKYIKKLENARDGWLLQAMQYASAEQTLRCVSVAQGIANVIADVNAGIDESKKDKEPNKK